MTLFRGIFVLLDPLQGYFCPFGPPSGVFFGNVAPLCENTSQKAHTK